MYLCAIHFMIKVTGILHDDLVVRPGNVIIYWLGTRQVCFWSFVYQ